MMDRELYKELYTIGKIRIYLALSPNVIAGLEAGDLLLTKFSSFYCHPRQLRSTRHQPVNARPLLTQTYFWCRINTHTSAIYIVNRVSTINTHTSAIYRRDWAPLRLVEWRTRKSELLMILFEGTIKRFSGSKWNIQKIVMKELYCILPIHRHNLHDMKV